MIAKLHRARAARHITSLNFELILKMAEPGLTYEQRQAYLPKCQLECRSGRIFIVPTVILKKAKVLATMIDTLKIGTRPEEVDEDIIPLPNVYERTMEKLIEWLTEHEEDPDNDHDDDELTFSDTLNEQDQEFFDGLDDGTLYDLTLAANYLDIKPLLNLCTSHIANLICKFQDPEEIRKRFEIPCDLTEEDFAEIERESENWLNFDYVDPERNQRRKERKKQLEERKKALRKEEFGETSQEEGGACAAASSGPSGDDDSDFSQDEGKESKTMDIERPETDDSLKSFTDAPRPSD